MSSVRGGLAAKNPAAVRTYNRLWRKASPFYGAQGQPSPFARRDPSVVHSAQTSAGAAPTVSISPFMWKALAGKQRQTMKPWADPRAPRQVRASNQRVAEKELLHEWAHVYQSRQVRENLDSSVPEYDASHFARAVAKRILAKKGKRQKLPLDRTQFGSNYGADPRTIR